MDKNIRREIILDNYKYPYHKGLIKDNSYILTNTRSSSCIDNIHLMLKIDDNIIKDAYFDGEACAICTSATSILLKKIINKNINEVNNILNNYENMINELKYDKELLNELLVYEDIYMQPSRKNCALLPSKAIRKTVDENGD